MEKGRIRIWSNEFSTSSVDTFGYHVKKTDSNSYSYSKVKQRVIDIMSANAGNKFTVVCSEIDVKRDLGSVAKVSVKVFGAESVCLLLSDPMQSIDIH
jgi:hypothetical protein